MRSETCAPLLPLSQLGTRRSPGRGAREERKPTGMMAPHIAIYNPWSGKTLDGSFFAVSRQNLQLPPPHPPLLPQHYSRATRSTRFGTAKNSSFKYFRRIPPTSGDVFGFCNIKFVNISVKSVVVFSSKTPLHHSAIAECLRHNREHLRYSTRTRVRARQFVIAFVGHSNKRILKKRRKLEQSVNRV